MVFSGGVFLFYFIVPVLIVYFALPRRAKNVFLLLASLIFYFLGDPESLPLLLLSAVANYLFGLIMSEKLPQRARKAALIASVVFNIALLGTFKYADFIVSNINALAGSDIALPGLTLPVGISFYTFQAMSYTIDVYRKNASVQKNFFSFATYLCLFPQLIAGPIVRYTDVEAELAHREHSFAKLSDGIIRFAVGLGKKVLLANNFALLAAEWQSATDPSVLYAWLGAAAYTLQIYFDFSGYSDMAIGMGKMFGFTFPENFNYPYISASVSEFWRRWHMTLSGWFRDYVYIPLGGNRRGLLRQCVNLAIVWMLTGLWHGAEWNFVLWGAMYGLLIILEKLFLGRFLEKHRIFGHIYTMFFVILGFVIFGASSLSDAFYQISVMFGFAGVPLVSAQSLYYLGSFALLIVIGIVGSTPIVPSLIKRIPDMGKTVLAPVFTLAMLLFSAAYIVDGSFNPFLYFRF